MEVGGAVAWTRATAELEMPVDVLEDSDTKRVEVHRKPLGVVGSITRSEEHTSELQSPDHLVCRLLLEKKKKKKNNTSDTGR